MRVRMSQIRRRWWWRLDWRKHWDIIAPEEDDDFTRRAVVPHHDAVAHDPFDIKCVCGPYVERDSLTNPDAYVVVHQALDGRR